MISLSASRHQGPDGYEAAKVERRLKYSSKKAVNYLANQFLWCSLKASKVETDMTEDVIRDVALPIDLVDVKVCAVDAIWSGLKLMIPRAKRVVN